MGKSEIATDATSGLPYGDNGVTQQTLATGCKKALQLACSWTLPLAALSTIAALAVSEFGGPAVPWLVLIAWLAELFQFLAQLPLNASRKTFVQRKHQAGALATSTSNFAEAWEAVPDGKLSAALTIICLLLALTLWIVTKKSPVLLLDFYCFHPPQHLGASAETFVEGMRRSKRWNEQSLDFMEKIATSSGLGSSTYFPEEIIAVNDSGKLDTTFNGARAETEMVLFTCIQKLLDSLNLKPKQIDAVIVNCTSFNPVPSLAACVINHFQMKSTVLGYTLSGMGCAASVAAVDLAQELLQNHPNMRICIASTENITSQLYFGSQRSMLLTNCLFRLGGSAAVLSNCRQDRRRAKYSLQHLVRTHLCTDQAYKAVMSREDEQGEVGISIGREVMNVAGRALTINIQRLAPLILPMSEKIIYAANLAARKVLKMKIAAYVPDFKLAIDHFAIHPGGKAVIDTVEKALSLSPKHAFPNREAFRQFGNTSSSSTWYAWSHIETHAGVKRGERLWQLAFGSGFKCNSAVWRCLRDSNTQHDAWTGKHSC